MKPEPRVLAEDGDEPPVGRTDVCKYSVLLGVHPALLATKPAGSKAHCGVKTEYFHPANREIQVYVSDLSDPYTDTVKLD